MTTKTDIFNRGLQSFGSRTTVTDSEIATNGSNEAIQGNLVYDSLRRQLLRMAPWNCGLKTANLVYITSTPGTPENTSPATTLWQPGQPPQPWAYEYQYPVDCLRPSWIIPATQTGFAGVPITTAVTGGTPAFWQGIPIKYKVQTDQFYPVLSATLITPGSGYVANEIITLAQAPQGTAPYGAPAQIKVLTVDGSGAILTYDIVNVVLDQSPAWAGSYFNIMSGAQAQGSTTGAGTGATFTLTQQATQSPQRVILTNQEFATMGYVQDVTDINVMDPLFIDAWCLVLGAYINFGLAGDKALSNMCIARANDIIIKARNADGNEGLTVNDVTPDFIRVRGVAYTEWYSGPYDQGWNWGPCFSSF